MLGCPWEFSVFNEQSLETLNTQLLPEQKEDITFSYQVTFIGRAKSFLIEATNETVVLKHSILHNFALISDDSVLMFVKVERRFVPRTLVAAISNPFSGNDNDQIKLNSFDSPHSTLNSRLFNSSEFSDVTLVVDNKKIPAHKFILMTNSPVFQQMLSGKWIESNSISITDSEAPAMYTLLRYMYCRELLVHPEYVFDTLYLLNKYLDEREMKDILSVCAQLVTLENVIQFYAYCVTFSEDSIGEVLKNCKAVMKQSQHPVKVIGKLTKCPYETIISLANENSINFNELSLFNACIEWAIEECKRRSLEPSNENLRSLILAHIRFTLMSPQELLNGPSRLGFLSDDEVMRILKYQLCDEKPIDFPFPTQARSGATVSSDGGPSKAKIIKLSR